MDSRLKILPSLLSLPLPPSPPPPLPQRFYAYASDKMRALTDQVVAAGQLEFVNGGWCQHDEASPSFVDMIDQTSLGHRLLLQQFNVTPKSTHQADPFGHSGFQGWCGVVSDGTVVCVTL